MILTRRDLLPNPSLDRRRFWDEIHEYVGEQYLGISKGSADFLIVFRHKGPWGVGAQHPKGLWGFKDWNADEVGCGWDELSEDDPIECYPVMERMRMTYEVIG